MIKLPKKIPVIVIDRYLATFFKISIFFLIIGFCFFTFTYLSPKTEIVKAEEVKWTPHSGKSILEVHIANNGSVFLQGARVESISELTLVVSTSWEDTKLLWTIITNGSDYGKRHFGTDIFDPVGNTINIKDIRVGDIITISGVFGVGQIGLTVNADVIRTSY